MCVGVDCSSWCHCQNIYRKLWLPQRRHFDIFHTMDCGWLLPVSDIHFRDNRFVREQYDPDKWGEQRIIMFCGECREWHCVIHSIMQRSDINVSWVAAEMIRNCSIDCFTITFSFIPPIPAYSMPFYWLQLWSCKLLQLWQAFPSVHVDRRKLYPTPWRRSFNRTINKTTPLLGRQSIGFRPK